MMIWTWTKLRKARCRGGYSSPSFRAVRQDQGESVVHYRTGENAAEKEVHQATGLGTLDLGERRACLLMSFQLCMGSRSGLKSEAVYSAGSQYSSDFTD